MLHRLATAVPPPSRNDRLQARISCDSKTGNGRLLTDLLLRTCHSGRRTRNRLHPANLDPKPSVVTVGFAAP